jgi:hypothetical protein
MHDEADFAPGVQFSHAQALASDKRLTTVANDGSCM